MLLEVASILLIVVSSTLLGVYCRDFLTRRQDIQAARALREDAHKLVDEYKALLLQINALDTTRAQKMVELQNRMEVVETKISMLSAKAKS